MNSRELKIQLVVENTANRIGLLAEHGLSYGIQTQDRSLLFDTGQGMALAHNAQALGIDLQKFDTIVLSHGHYDHSGGLRFFTGYREIPTIYAHPGAWQKRYEKTQKNQIFYAGVPENLEESWWEKVQNQTIRTEQSTQIMEGVWITGVVPRENEWEHSTGSFYLDPECRQDDELKDDQSMFFLTEQGVVVLLGCAHSGAVNTLRYIEKLTHGREIACVIGGMHLLRATSERIQRTIEEFHRMNVKKIAPCHCSGAVACHALRSAFGDRYLECPVGTEFQFILES